MGGGFCAPQVGGLTRLLVRNVCSRPRAWEGGLGGWVAFEAAMLRCVMDCWFDMITVVQTGAPRFRQWLVIAHLAMSCVTISHSLNGGSLAAVSHILKMSGTFRGGVPARGRGVNFDVPGPGVPRRSLSVVWPCSKGTQQNALQQRNTGPRSRRPSKLAWVSGQAV